MENTDDDNLTATTMFAACFIVASRSKESDAEVRRMLRVIHGVKDADYELMHAAMGSVIKSVERDIQRCRGLKSAER